MKTFKRFSVGLIILCLGARLLAQESNTESPPQPPSVQQQKQPPQRVRISQGVAERNILKKVQPKYPSEARKQHVQGSVLIQVLISKTGEVTNPKVISGDELLAPSAVEAVTQWKYKPYTLNGQPIEVETQIIINFQLH
jgi:protein TonB